VPGLQVYLATEARAALKALDPQRRARLRVALWRLAASAPEGLAQARTQLDVAACEAEAGGRALLVYAIVARREVLRSLWGVEIDERLRRSEESRLLHGRWY
jgi:hypothetical protein